MRAKIGKGIPLAVIFLTVSLPVLCAGVGASGGIWISIESLRAKAWQSLGRPASKPEQLLGLCTGTICTATEDGQQYRYDRERCSQPTDQACWTLVTSGTVIPIVPHLYNPCLFEYDIPSPPSDAIQVLGAKECSSGGDAYVYYSLLEDGSIWKWEHYIGDMASLLVIGLTAQGLVVGFAVGLVAAILVFALGWPYVNDFK